MLVSSWFGYDGRGSGQSGGRTESAGLVAYRDDVLSVIQWVRRRRDVDGDRMVIVGYGDSGPIALLAAEREDRIKGVALLAALDGPDARPFSSSNSACSRGSRFRRPSGPERIKLQAKVNEAAVTGKGWEEISDDVRRQADTPWFEAGCCSIPADARGGRPACARHSGRARHGGVPRRRRSARGART